MLASTTVAIAQQQVKGVVISGEDQLPVIGASIVVPGTSIGTVTDFNGNFSLDVPSNVSTVIVSYVGLETQEVAVSGNMRVVLSADAEELDEVVVVAYGTAKKSSFTGAVASVSGEKISKLQVSSVTKALEGATPGVQVVSASGQPGENAKIRIRGIGSFSASSAPLYVVDGMPYSESAMNAINPADIENISVLKDAASAALYGSRAANGVVMITTKKGREEKTRVSLDARYGVNSRAIPNYDIMIDPGEYLTTYWNVLKNTNDGDGQKASTNLITDLGYNPYQGVANNMVVDANGVLTDAPLRYTDNWEDETLGNGARQEYNISLRGGSKFTKHFLSFGYLSDEGILQKTDFDRFSVRANLSHEINKYIDLGANMAYSRSEQNAGSHSDLSNYSNAFMYIQNIAPIYPVYAYDQSGDRVYDDQGNPIYDFGDGTYGVRPGGFSNSNSAATSELNENRDLRDNFSGRGYLNLNLYKGLKLTANVGYDAVNGTSTTHMNAEFGDAQNVGGRTYKYNTRSQTITANQLLTYNFELGNHGFDFLVGHESYLYNYSYQYASKYNFYTLGNPEFNNAITMDGMQSYTQAHSMESYLGRVNYDYADKYYLSGSIRTDASSKFHPDHRQGTFYSVGGSWRINQEDFLIDHEVITDLKLKASYGTQGNDGILDGNGYMVYQPYMQQFEVSNNNGDFSVVEVYRGNPDLTWETSQNFNIGAEIGLWHNRLRLDVDYFLKKTSDMLYNMPYPISSGISYVPMNLLDMNNSGFEFTLSATPIKTRDFTWNISVNGSRYLNEVTSLPDEKKEDGIIHAGYYRLKEGGTVYDFYNRKYAGVDSETGHSLWYKDELNENGEVIGQTTTETYDDATYYDLGTSLPDFQGAINTDFRYKGWDLAFQANFQLGGQIYDSMYAGFMQTGNDPGSNFHRDVLNAWTPENKKSNIPVMDASQSATSFSDRFLIDASYFNIRNITLGYSLPNNWAKAITASSARIYFSADNVALFSKRKGMDPRQYISGQSLANYSAIRSMSVGVNVNF